MPNAQDSPPPAVRGLNPGALFAQALSSLDARMQVWTPPAVEELQRALPHYEITALIGRGGMGAVYQAWQTRLERQVAIKVLPARTGHNDEAGFAIRFQREAKAMARLSHPGIVAVHDAGETSDGLLFFVMDFVEGMDLQKLLAARGPLPMQEAVAITGSVCDALAYAHRQGVIHRDIKPSNVMIAPDGTVKVADFGLAKVLASEPDFLTGSNDLLGTRDYLAPEATVASGEVDHRADVYAVGVVLYQMLTGKIPRGRFEPPSRLGRGIDRRLDAVVDRALQADPAARYASADEMRDALATIAPHAKRAGAGRSRRAWMLAASVVLVLTAAVAFQLLHRRSAAPVSGSPPPTSAPARAAIRLWDSPQKVAGLEGVRWENGAVVLKRAFIAAEGRLLRNSRVRAEVRIDPAARGAGLRVRRTGAMKQGAESYYRFGLSADARRLFLVCVVRSHSQLTLQSWPIPAGKRSGDWLALQLQIIDDQISVWIDGQPAGVFHDPTLTEPGETGIFGIEDGAFRNIEYVPLD